MEIVCLFSSWSIGFSLDLNVELIAALFLMFDTQFNSVLKILLTFFFFLSSAPSFSELSDLKCILRPVFSFPSNLNLFLPFAFSVVLICSFSAASRNSFCNKHVWHQLDANY